MGDEDGPVEGRDRRPGATSSKRGAPASAAASIPCTCAAPPTRSPGSTSVDRNACRSPPTTRSMHTSTTRSRVASSPVISRSTNASGASAIGRSHGGPGGRRGHAAESTFKTRARARRPSSPQRRARLGWRTSGADPRGRRRRRPGASVHDSPDATSTIVPFSVVRYSVVPGTCGMPTRRAPAGISMRSISIPGMGSGKSLRIATGPRIRTGTVLAGKCFTAERGAAMSSSMVTWRASGGAVEDGKRGVGVPALEVGPGRARHAGEPGHLLLGQPARLAQLGDVGRQAARDVARPCPQLEVCQSHWQGGQ